MINTTLGSADNSAQIPIFAAAVFAWHPAKTTRSLKRRNTPVWPSRPNVNVTSPPHARDITVQQNPSQARAWQGGVQAPPPPSFRVPSPWPQGAAWPRALAPHPRQSRPWCRDRSVAPVVGRALHSRNTVLALTTVRSARLQRALVLRHRRTWVGVGTRLPLARNSAPGVPAVSLGAQQTGRRPCDARRPPPVVSLRCTPALLLPPAACRAARRQATKGRTSP